MQCGELVYRKVTTMTKGSRNQSRPEKETIHSGHFMVSHFEAEAQDDEDDLAVPVPEEDEVETKITVAGIVPIGITVHAFAGTNNKDDKTQQQISIETSLNKLFQCMSLAYRQKLTSPKWNRFKGIKLRWKDKIRLNNVIWRCWHMQFIMKRNTLVCQFASPLDVDTHIKPEATILEGKYWKRRAEAVTAEYKKWRMYYRNRTLGWGPKDVSDVISDMDVLDWHSQGDNSHMLVDEDYIAFMSDTLFSTISSNQPFAFPDTREIARVASLADFIQPSLGPLQPNLEDFMDTFEPLQELFTAVKLPPVPEESATSDDHVYRNNISQALMDPSFQQALEQTTQYPITPMLTQHIHNIPVQLPQQQNRQSSIHAVSDQMMSHSTMASNMQMLNESYIARQSEHGHSLHTGQNSIQNSAGSHPNHRANPMSQIASQRQSIMVQPYGMNSSNMGSQQNSTMMSQHQSVLQTQQQQQQQQQHQQLQNQKMYPQIPVINYHEGTYGNQGMHQTRSENPSFGTASQRARSGSGGYPPERVSRSRPSASYPHHFNVSPTATSQAEPMSILPDKPPYSHCMEQQHSDRLPPSSNTNTGLTQLNLSASICMGNLNNPSEQQNVPIGPANLSLQGTGRFKMPSPPPQIGNPSISSHNRQMSPGSSTQQQQQQHQQQQLAKGESFRSNSLPLGASLGSVLGATRTRRRPRSGSSSPAPPRRAPLLAAASEPLLSPSSVLLAHLLNTNKTQGIYKPTSIQSLASESASSSKHPHQIAILPAPASGPITVPASFSSSSPQLSSFGGCSPTNATSPQSPPSPLDGSGGPCREHRRAGHIHAEQKRRYNIKNGFDVLQSLIPQLSQSPNAKVSKAAMLQKGAEYVRQLQTERNQMKEEMDGLRQQIECLNNSISNCQSLLPATGAPVSRQRSGRLKEMFDEYVCQRTNENWKFWIFSLLVEPLLTSFNNSVSPASTDELKRSTFLWTEQHCSLVEMRPAVLNSLRMLCTTTEILSDPDRLPEEARAAVNKKKPKDSNSSCK